MEINQKITQKEWKDYVENQMYHHGFTPKERAHVNAAFSGDMRDAEHGETAGFLGHVKPGITSNELADAMAMLKDEHSDFSKNAKLRLHPEKVDKLEEILHKALVENKESFF
ncbi:MAG: hypothetical protein AAB598_02000 [Patescibacteria group bacterium]